jgi:hypothetical protein
VGHPHVAPGTYLRIKFPAGVFKELDPQRAQRYAEGNRNLALAYGFRSTLLWFRFFAELPIERG